MKKNRRFLAAGICILLSVLFVFSANVLSSEVSFTQAADSYYETVADSGHGDSGGWIDKDEDMKNEYEEEYREEAENRDDEFESAPSDSEDESSTEESFEPDYYYRDEYQDESEEKHDEFESAPSDSEDESSTE